jgi:PilZ domain
MNDNLKKAPLPAGSGKSAGVKELERRSEDRHMFTASAEVVELSSGARFSTRTTDLGPGGCFIDTTNPLPVGAEVRVAVRKGKNEFHTPGTVVYSQYGLGMGVSFAELDAEQRKALSLWIGEITRDVHGSAAPHSAQRVEWGEPNQRIGSDRAALVRLVRLMITKGILTEAEGSSVFVDPVL